MNRDFFQSMPEQDLALIYGKRTGLPFFMLVEISRDPAISLTRAERCTIEADIDEIKRKKTEA